MLYTPIAALFLLITSYPFATSGDRLCTIIQQHAYFREDTAQYIVARATLDSIYVGTFFVGEDGVTPVKPPGPSIERAVFGQVFTIIDRGLGAERGYKVGQKVVLVWWTHDSECNKDFPQWALGLPAGDDVFLSLSPQPRSEWAAGLPTFDASTQYRGTNALYSPLFEPRMIHWGRVPIRRDVMDARDFAQLFASLSLASSIGSDSDQPFLLIDQWAKRNPRIARLYPASILVDMARANLTRQSR